MLRSTQAWIIATVGVTALIVSVFLMAAFFGYLYFVRDAERIQVASPKPIPTQTPRRRGSVAAAEITTVEFTESVYSSSSGSNVSGFLGNVNPQNNKSSTKTVSFSSDGSAMKRISGERTVNGRKITDDPATFSAQISPADFALLAAALVENDFANQADARTSSSLPIKKVLTVMYASGTKIITTDNMDRDIPELNEILSVFRSLENKAVWKSR